MHRPKLVFSVGGFLFNGRLLRRRTIGCFTLCPRALEDVKLLPVLVGSRQFPRYENRVFRNDDKLRVGDWVV